MVTNIKQTLGEIEDSFKEMKGTLHWWDAVDNKIDAELKNIQNLVQQTEVDAATLNELVESRDQLRRLTQKEIADNIDNLEKATVPVVGTLGVLAVAGASAAVYLGWVGVGAVLKGGLPAAGAVFASMAGMGKTALEFLQKQLAAHWYYRWAPVPLGMAFGAGRTAMVSLKQEKMREKMAVSVPEDLLHRIQTDTVSLDEGINLAHKYAHDVELMENLLPKLYRQTVTPEGGLLLTHHLLESFSMSDSLNANGKVYYSDIINREFDQVLRRYGEWVLTLGLTGAKESAESLYQSGDIRIRGYIVQPGIDDLMNEMNKEKKALQVMMQVHGAWLSGKGNAVQVVFERRKAMVERGLPLVWGGVQRKLDDLPVYIETVRTGFQGMMTDFEMKNPALWQSFAEHAGDYWGSRGGMIGYFSSMLFLKGGWSLMFKGIPFMIAGSWVEASYKAEEAAYRRLPVQLCIPSYGTLCESL